MQKLQVNDPTLNSWLGDVFKVPADSFAQTDPTQSFLFEPFVESRAGIGFFLKRAVDPYRGVTGVSWKAHAAEPGGVDLLGSDYQAAGFRVSLLESCNFIVVRVFSDKRADDGGTAGRDFVSAVLSRVIEAETPDHHWVFEIDERLKLSADPVLVSSRGAPPVLDIRSRHDRADLLVSQNEVTAIFYKKIEQIKGFRKADEWFSAEARAAIRASVAQRTKRAAN